MTIEEIVAGQPFLKVTEDKQKIYLIPTAKFGFQSFPVGKEETVTKTRKRELPEDYVMPEGISKEEREQIETEHYRETVFTFDERARAVTAEEYEALMNRTMCWDADGNVVKYEEPKLVTDSKALVAKEDELLKAKEEAQAWLTSKDYIGTKIAQVSLVGTTEELEALKKEYAGVIKEAKEKRALINECDAWLEENGKALETARGILFNEN